MACAFISHSVPIWTSRECRDAVRPPRPSAGSSREPSLRDRAPGLRDGDRGDRRDRARGVVAARQPRSQRARRLRKYRFRPLWPRRKAGPPRHANVARPDLFRSPSRGRLFRSPATSKIACCRPRGIGNCPRRMFDRSRPSWFRPARGPRGARRSRSSAGWVRRRAIEPQPPQLTDNSARPYFAAMTPALVSAAPGGAVSSGGFAEARKSLMVLAEMIA